MADDDIFRFLSRLPAQQYVRLRKFLLGKNERRGDTSGDDEVDVASGQTKKDGRRPEKNKKPRS